MMRSVIFLALFIIFCPLPAMGKTNNHIFWSQFVSSFITEDGRVIDWQNCQCSHSEGQGYSMVAAVIFDDRQMFDKLYTWSTNNLGGVLHAWKWGEKNNKWQIIDANNATDGDILHAWALFLAGERWQVPGYTTAAHTLLDEIRTKLIWKNDILLPGLNGFVNKDEATINMSYYIFPALKDFMRFDAENKAVWERVYNRGLQLIKETAQNELGFSPDWIQCNAQGDVIVSPKTLQFGYEAIRVPLYLALAHEKGTIELFRPLLYRVSQTKKMEAVYNFDGSPVFPAAEALAGNYAVLARAASELGMTEVANTLWELARTKAPLQKGNYYGTILYLMALFF